MEEARRAERALQMRANNLQEGVRRRQNRACQMLCGESHDMGVERMKTFGARYRKAVGDKNDWVLPSLSSVHKFSKEVHVQWTRVRG